MANSPLAATLSQMVVDFVAEDTCKPSALGSLTRKTPTRFNGREEGLLDNVLGHIWVAHLANGEVEKIIGVGFHPIATKSRVALRVHCQFRCSHHSDFPFCKVRATKLAEAEDT